MLQFNKSPVQQQHPHIYTFERKISHFVIGRI
jgi:hypothetical protein